MARHTNLNVRIGGELSDFLDTRIGEDGLYDNASEYVRSLIRRDKELHEEAAFRRLKAELQQAFAEPDTEFEDVSAQDIFARYPPAR